MTPDFWYSPTLFSKKLVFPSNDILSMKSKGFDTLNTCNNTIIINNKKWQDKELSLITLGWSKATSNLSATNSMYCFIRSQFIPISLTGRASVRNYDNIEINNNSYKPHIPNKCPTCTVNGIQSNREPLYRGWIPPFSCPPPPPPEILGIVIIIIGQTSCSIVTASQITFLTSSGDGLCISFLNNRHAKSQCNPSSRLINSFENVNPGINPLMKNKKNEKLN